VPPLTSSVVLTVHVSPGSQPFVYGETNLPDGTSLRVGIEEPCPGDLIARGYHGEATIKGGRYVAGPLGGSGIPSGTYVVVALMPHPDTQSEEVQAVIGKDGETLRGGQVKRGPGGDVTVEAEVPLVLGDLAEAARETQKRCTITAERVRHLERGKR
jgi:hypothetical protein